MLRLPHCSSPVDCGKLALTLFNPSPHVVRAHLQFEKMLYDNPQLALAYLGALQVGSGAWQLWYLVAVLVAAAHPSSHSIHPKRSLPCTLETGHR